MKYLFYRVYKIKFTLWVKVETVFFLVLSRAFLPRLVCPFRHSHSAVTLDQGPNFLPVVLLVEWG